jgi:hypothetical protein
MGTFAARLANALKLLPLLVITLLAAPAIAQQAAATTLQPAIPVYDVVSVNFKRIYKKKI